MNLANLFAYAALTEAVNKLPNMQTKMGASGLFKETGLISTRFFGVEYREARLFLVPITDINDKPRETRRGRRNRIILECAHLPVSGVILPGELHSIAPFGQDQTGQQQNMQAIVINDRLQELKNSIEATREWHRLGAMKGQVLDSDGEIYYDLYEVFGVTAKRIPIAFATATTDVRALIMEGKRHAEQRLFGAMVTGFRAYAGKAFMDKFTSHPNVEKAWAGYQAAESKLGGDVRAGFRFGDVEWIEYDCTVSGKKFIDDNKAHMFPVGQGIFAMNNGIANYNEALGTVGEPWYAKAKERDMNKGWDIEVQANPGAINLYPEAMVEFSIG